MDELLRIEPVARISASTMAFEQLKALIIGGRWVGGQVLPAQRELCKMLGIGRTTLREALGALEAIGLVGTRHGKGTYVAAGLLRSDSGFGQWDAAHASSLTDLLALRYALEPVIAAVAARRRTDADLERAEAAQSRMQAGLRARNAETVAYADVQFHCALASASGDPVFSKTLDSLLYLVIDSCRTSSSAYAAGSPAHEAHQRVLDAIAARVPAEAALAMRSHIRNLVNLLEREGFVKQVEIEAVLNCRIEGQD